MKLKNSILALFIVGAVGTTTVYADQVNFYTNPEVAKTSPCVSFDTAVSVTNANQKCTDSAKQIVYFHLCEGTKIGDREVETPYFTATAAICTTDATKIIPAAQFVKNITDKLRSVKVTDKTVIIDTLLGLCILLILIKFITRKKQDVES